MFLRSLYLGVLLVCCLEFLSIQKEAEEAENEQVVRKKKSHLIEDLKVGKKFWIILKISRWVK